MGDTRRLFASSLEERNSVGVGTFQPSFGFKDFHQPARLYPPPAVTRDGDHQLLGGEKQAGLSVSGTDAEVDQPRPRVELAPLEDGWPRPQG
jgi:hypothetical protein